MQKSYTYILRCSDMSYYTGWTTNLQKRLQAHQNGTASKYTRARLPVELMYYESFASKKEAMQREYAIKQLSRKQKHSLVVQKKTK